MQACGLWGPRNIHKKVWELSVPQFNSGDKMHLTSGACGSLCTKSGKDGSPPGKTFEGRRGPRVIGRVRTAVREALNEELAEIDGIVKGILN